MSNPHDPQYPGHPQQPGQTTPVGQPTPTTFQPAAAAPGHSGAHAGYPGAQGGYPGAQSGYPGGQPGYPGAQFPQQAHPGAGYGQKPPKRKKPLLKRWWFWLIVIIVVIAMFSAIGGGGDDATDETGASSAQDEAGTGSEDKGEGAPAEEGGAPAAEKAAYGIGDSVAADGWEITVDKVEDGVASVGDEFLGTEAQGQFVTVALSVKNTESEPDYFFEDNIKLGDDKGNSYSADSEAGIYVDENSILFLEEINPGNTAKGVLVFDVPKVVSPDRLTFEGGIFSNPVEIALN